MKELHKPVIFEELKSTTPDKLAIANFGEAGTGKAQPVDTPILTPGGWVSMGDIEAGHRVVTPTNKHARVLSVFPQGIKSVQRVTFSDGRSTECCLEHLWEVFTQNWTRSGGTGYRVLTTAAIKDYLDRYSENLAVRLCCPIDLSFCNSFAIPPYSMGALLGNGGFTRTTPIFSDDDKFVIDAVSRELKNNLGVDLNKLTTDQEDPDYSITAPYGTRFNPLTTLLSGFGLWGKYSHEKHIPTIYKGASVESRWELIAGLMDTDGTCNGNNASFSTSSEALAYDFQEVIWSLGGRAKITGRKPYYTHAGEHREGRYAYRVWPLIDDPRKLFRSPVHLSKLNGNYQYALAQRLRIESVEYSRDVETQCILIDDPGHLYVTEKFIPTHNTRFIVTAPAPIGVVPLDRKTRRTIEKSNNGKRILFPKEDYIRHDNPMKLAMMEPDAARDYYRKHVNQIKDAIYTLAERQDVKTIAVDSASQLWEDILFANYGRNQKIMPRDRGSANQEMIDLLNSLQHKHVILTHKAREIWRQDKPTGRYEAVGFPHIDYHVNVIVEHTRDEKTAKFGLSVKLCQENAALHGDEGRNLLTDDDITFQMLALRVFEGSDPEEWE